MNWVTPVIAVILACYGWWLIVQHAKYREAYELYASIISLLDQLVDEGKKAWVKNMENLDQHTELKFLLLLEAVEQRLNILILLYSNSGKSMTAIREQILQLRHYLTAVPIKLGTEISRSNGILRVTHGITSTLLNQNYQAIEKGRQRSVWIGSFVLLLCILIAAFGNLIADLLIDFVKQAIQ